MISRTDLLDRLFEDDISSEDNINLEDNEVVIPRRCSLCRNSVICSILPTFMGMSKLKIFLSVEACPYFSPIQQKKKKSGS